MRRPIFFVYILSSLNGTLYVGLTDDLVHRLYEHRTGKHDGFTRKYQVNRLLYFETYSDSHRARAREKQVKAYSRAKKIALFAESNPSWRDLGRDLARQLYAINRVVQSRAASAQ